MNQLEKIYVGNIAYSVTECELYEIFKEFGNIEEVAIIKDKENGKSKGFAFIRFTTPQQATDALILHGMELKGRNLVVNQARPKSQYSLRDLDLRAKYKDLGVLL